MIPDSIRAVYFDAVGTLIFPTPGAPEAYADYARRVGVPLDAAAVRTRMIAAYNAEEDTDEAAGWVTSEAREIARWRRVVTETLRDVPDPTAAFDELYTHFATPSAWTVNPDAVEVFAELARRGLKLGLASNYDSRLLAVFDGLPELAPVRGSVVVSSLVGVRKPGAGFFAEVCRVAGCGAAEIAFVGDDRGNDYDGATAAGMFAVLLDDRGRHPAARGVSRLGEILGS